VLQIGVEMVVPQLGRRGADLGGGLHGDFGFCASAALWPPPTVRRAERE